MVVKIAVLIVVTTVLFSCSGSSSKEAFSGYRYVDKSSEFAVKYRCYAEIKQLYSDSLIDKRPWTSYDEYDTSSLIPDHIYVLLRFYNEGYILSWVDTNEKNDVYAQITMQLQWGKNTNCLTIVDGEISNEYPVTDKDINVSDYKLLDILHNKNPSIFVDTFQINLRKPMEENMILLSNYEFGDGKRVINSDRIRYLNQIIINVYLKDKPNAKDYIIKSSTAYPICIKNCGGLY